jgi:hypothetical protein
MTVGYIENQEKEDKEEWIQEGNEAEVLSVEQKPNINKDLTETQKKKIQQILDENEDVFAKRLCELPGTKLVTAKIELLENAKPIFFRPYRTSQVEVKAITENLEEMLEANIIRPSMSTFSSPVLVVKKKTGGYRLVNDYRHLNKIIKDKDRHPIPLIDEILSNLGKMKYFSTSDLFSGYFQVPLAEEDKYKTAFLTKKGHFEYNVLPQGLANAPAEFVKLMTLALRNEKDCCFA